VSDLLEEILDHHEIADEDVESSLETLAVEYSKQDGLLSTYFAIIFNELMRADATMKVSVEILKRVYNSLQDQGQKSDDKELLDPDNHLHTINAFEMPLWHWYPESGTFQRFVPHILVLRMQLDHCAGSRHP
jgi:DNA polymerase epsilon subunit 2